MVMGDVWEHSERPRMASAGVDKGSGFMVKTACKVTKVRKGFFSAQMSPPEGPVAVAAAPQKTGIIIEPPR